MNRKLLLVAAFAAAAVLPADGYIEAIYPLQQFMNESQVIAEGVIDKSDSKTRTCVVKITKSLKGKCAYPELRINIGAGQEWHPDAVMKHLVVGAPALFFFDGGGRGEIYINRFFNQLYADGQAPEKAWWTFTHIEIRCNRTFNGTTEDLTKLVGDVLAGKSKPPGPDAKIPPISKGDVAALPVWGQPAENDKLPAPFRKRDPNAAPPAQPVAVSGEGFIQRWLLLGPIALGPQASDHTENGQKAFFEKEWFPGQKGAQPRPLQKVSSGGLDLKWDVSECTDFYLDFGAADNSMHFVVAYVVSDKDVADATLATGSDDSGIWWLNGQEVIRVYSGRGIGKDQDRSKPLALKKGLNVLIGAVINGSGPTGACARFLDKAGAALTDLKAGAEPPK